MCRDTILRTLNTFMTLKITEVEAKHHLLAFEMRVVRGLYYPTHIKGYINVTESALFFAHKNLTQSALFFNIKMSPPSANFKNSMKNRVTQKCLIFVYKNVSQIVLLFAKCLAFCI